MKVELVSGKGGVGKSAVAAALARKYSRSGERVLAISMLPNGSLGAHLGVRDVDSTARTGVDGVSVSEIRRSDALEDYIRTNSPIPVVVGLKRAVSLFDSLANTAPGVREITTIGKVIHEAESGAWDRVIVDSAPTGQFASYLNAPSAIADIVSGGPIKRQAEKIEVFLREKARITYVTLAEELPVVEMLSALSEVTPCPLQALYVNRMLAPLDAVVPPGQGPLTEAGQLHQAIVEQQQEWLGRLPTSIQLPFLFGTTEPLAISEALADVIGAIA